MKIMKILALKKLAVLSLLGGSMVSGTALAAPCGNSGSGLQGVLDGITTAPTAGTSSVNVTNDCLADSSDSSWAISGSGIAGTTMIIEIAGYAGTNTFGVYDTTDSSNFVELFDGASSAGNQVVMSIKADGSVFKDVNNDTGINFAGNSFGYYLDVQGQGDNRYYSDTSLNDDSFDHLLAYQGTGVDTVQLPGLAAGTWTQNEYILAWEDLYGGGDKDFTDMVLMVESVTPVPIPAAAWLFGSGLIGLAGIARRKKAAA